MYGNSIYQHKAITSFCAAETFFAETPKPRGRKWADPNYRPLYKASTQHFVLYKGDDGRFYDICLYGTPLIRYFAPDSEHNRTVWLRGYNSKMSWDLLWRHGKSPGSSVVASDGRNVHTPLNPLNLSNDYMADNGVVVPANWSAVWFLDCVSRPLTAVLDLERSAHRPVFRAVSDEGDKEKRAFARKRLDMLLDVMVYRIPTYHEQASLNWRKARAFGASLSWQQRNNLKHSLRPYLAQPELEITESLVEAVSEAGRGLYEKYVNMWANEQGRLSYSTNETPSDVPMQDPHKFRTALNALLMREMGLDTQSGRVALPQFMDELPRRYFWR